MASFPSIRLPEKSCCEKVLIKNVKKYKTVALIFCFLYSFSFFRIKKEAQKHKQKKISFFSCVFQQFLARYRTYRGKYKTVLVSHYTDPQKNYIFKKKYINIL
jgi:hypothetical protein